MQGKTLSERWTVGGCSARVIDNYLVEPGYRRTMVEADGPVYVCLDGDRRAGPVAKKRWNWAWTFLAEFSDREVGISRIESRHRTGDCIRGHWFVYIVYDGKIHCWVRSLTTFGGHADAIDKCEGLLFYPKGFDQTPEGIAQTYPHGLREPPEEALTVGDLLRARRKEFNRWLRWFLVEGLGPSDLRHGWHGTDEDLPQRVDWLLDPDNWRAQQLALTGILLDAGDKSKQVWASERRRCGVSGGHGALGFRQMLNRIQYAVELQSAIEQEGGYGTEYIQERVDGWREEQKKIVEDLAWAILGERTPEVLRNQ